MRYALGAGRGRIVSQLFIEALVLASAAAGIADEALRDRRIRERFPAKEYLTARVSLDREAATADGEESPAAFSARLKQTCAGPQVSRVEIGV